jgi:hypothetical protein
MPAANIGGWIRTGVWALPVYGLLTFWATFTHEPNRHTEVEAYAHYISTANYLAQHLLGSILGVILAVLGVIALGAYLASSRSGRLALLAMVLSVAGHCLLHDHLTGYWTVVPGRPARNHESERGHLQLSGVYLSRGARAAALRGGHHPLWRGDLALWNSATIGPGSSTLQQGCSSPRGCRSEWPKPWEARW